MDGDNERCRGSVRNKTFQYLYCRKVGATYKYFRNIFWSIAKENVKDRPVL
jgi:hypothetical protein